MSINARRIIEIKTEESYISFNLWDNPKLIEFLDSDGNFFSQLSEDGIGIAEASIEKLEEAVEYASELSLNSDTVTNLKKDIEVAKAEGEEFIQYYCY